MRTTNYSNNINLIPLVINILYNEADDEVENEFLDLINKIAINELDTDNIVWVLNCLIFLEINNCNNRVKFMRIQGAKLKILANFVAEKEYLKNILSEENLHVEEVFEKNETGATIYKQYIPTANAPFKLPAKGGTEHLKITCYDDNEDTYEAVVKINDIGIVSEVVKPLTLKENPIMNTKFDDLYTDLLTDMLNYDDKDE